MNTSTNMKAERTYRLQLLLLLLLMCTICGDTSCHIEGAQGLIEFSRRVNSGEKFEGSTVFLNSDADLSGKLSDDF